MASAWVLVRSLSMWFLFLGLTVVLLVLSIPFILFRLGHPMFSVGILWARAGVMILGIPVEVEGLERLQRKGPFVIISNHQSMLDIVVMIARLPIRYAFMAKHSLFRIPLFGGGMRAVGCIPVDRGNAARARESMFRAAETVRKGTNVVVYPEGTRGLPDGTMRPFKAGGFIMAQKAGVVIQPLTIWGASNVMPADKSNWIQRIYHSPVKLVVHEPIKPEQFADLSPQELSDKLRAIIESPMARLREEIPIKHA